MAKYKNLIKEIKNLISSNKTGEALEILAQEQLSSVDKDLILINSRYAKLTEEQRLGVVDPDDAQRMLNKINLDLLALAEIIEKGSTASVDKKTTSEPASPVAATPSPISQSSSAAPAKSNTMMYALIGLGLLVAIGAGWFFMQSNQKAKTEIAEKNKAAELAAQKKKRAAAVQDSIEKAKVAAEAAASARQEQIKLGAEFEGGIIFYIDETGKHGLIMTQGDQTPEDIHWFAPPTVNAPVQKAGAYSAAIYGGIKNTEKIVKAFGPGSYPAKICADLEWGGHNDWYLPSQKELDLMYSYNNHQGFSNKYYWSSTEIPNADVYYRSFHNGRSYKRLPKQNDYRYQNQGRVRAIRKF